MKIKSVKCPNCKKSIKINSNSSDIICEYCDTHIYVDDDASKVERLFNVFTKSMDRSKEKNEEPIIEVARINLEKIKLEKKYEQNILKWGIILFIMMMGVISIMAHYEEEDTRIEIPFTLKEVRKEPFQIIEQQLKDAGFTNINFIKIEDLKFGLFKSDNDIETLTVNGSEDFIEGERFEPNAKIMIYYHTFPEE